MANFNSFTPIGSNKTIAVTTASASVALDLPGRDRALRVYNALGGVVFLAFGVGSAVAAATDLAIAPGETAIFEVPQKATHVAVIAGTGSGNFYCVEGQGA